MLGVAPNVAGRCFFPANPDLADILGDMDFEFYIFHVLFLIIPNFQRFQVPKLWIFQDLDFPASQHLDFPTSQIWISQLQKQTHTDGRGTDGRAGGQA